MIDVKNQDFINASKAITTVCLTILATYWFLPPVSLYLTLYTACCCALMQAGETKLQQLAAMVLAGFIFIFFLILGLYIKNNILLANIGLIVFAFGAFYLPNLGVVYKMPPVLGLIYYVLIIHLSTASCPFGLTILGHLAGVTIAILVYFLFWPYEVKHELTLIAKSLAHQYQIILKRYILTTRLTKPIEAKAQKKYFKESFKMVNQLLLIYEKLYQNTALKKVELVYFDVLYLRLYSILQINQMMYECFLRLNITAYPDGQRLLRDLHARLKEIEYRFDQLIPHSLIAKYLIGTSLKFSKTLILPLFRFKKKPHAYYLSKGEFNALLEKIIDKEQPFTKQFAFALLRFHDLLCDVRRHQENIEFNFTKGIFL